MTNGRRFLLLFHRSSRIFGSFGGCAGFLFSCGSNPLLVDFDDALGFIRSCSVLCLVFIFPSWGAQLFLDIQSCACRNPTPLAAIGLAPKLGT